MTGKGIFAKKYVKCGLYDHFTTLLSHKGNPVVFTGVNDYGNREVVFAFDFIGDSNFTLTPDYVALCENLIDYSFPTVLNKTDYVAGETLSVNIVSGTDSIMLTSPSGAVTSLPVSGVTSEILLTESGVYKIELTAGDKVKDYYVFASFPIEETVSENGEAIGLIGQASDSGIDGIYDNIVILVVLLLLLFSADWVVYCYEKYQLR
jgi:hypothetical protein